MAPSPSMVTKPSASGALESASGGGIGSVGDEVVVQPLGRRAPTSRAAAIAVRARERKKERVMNRP